MPNPTRAATTPQPNAIHDTLPEQIVQRLAGHDIHDLHDWRRLSHSQRRSLFGITRRVREQLNAMAKEVRLSVRGAP